ncbi:MAG: sialidase family protein [Acidobacteriota bacterium]|nr:sialidase family protein [Acidobacteriota bacterium]
MRAGISMGLFCCALLFPLSLGQSVFVDREQTVAIDPSRGVDSLVDYAALVRFGPWDDRNYALTRGDIAVLAANEAELRMPIPAFFRVELRQSIEAMGRRSDVRYPLYALNVFRQHFGGYLVDGVYYREASRDRDRYYVDLSRPAPSAPRAGTDAALGESRVTNPEGAAESAIAINPVDTSRVIAGSNGPDGGQKMHYSTDGGATWTQTTLPLGGTCCDPSVEWSSDGQYAYTTTLGCFIIFCDIWFYRSDDGGVTWTGLENETPGDPRREVASADREFLHVDLSPTSPYQDNIYITYHNGNVMRFARSTDFGNTFTTKTFSNASEDMGIAGDIATDRAGNIYYVWPSFNSRTIRLLKSTDGGDTFGPVSVIADTNASFSYPIPAMESREVAVYVSAAADLSDGPYADSIYLSWADATSPPTGDPASNHSHIQVAYTHDGGATWTLTTPHETDDALTVDRWQSFLAVGPDGTVHLVFHDTRRSADRSGSDIFYTYSTDGAQTWSAPSRVTSEISPNIADSFEYGDYNGLSMVMNDLMAIYTDNRNESGGGGDSVDVYSAGIEPGTAPSSGAGRIPGAKDVTGTPLTVTKVGGGDLQLDWSVVCGAGSDYAVYEGLLSDPESKQQRQCSTGGATSTTLTPSTGQRFYLVVAQGDGAEGSYGQASDGSERTPATDACLPQTISSCP